MDTACNRAEHNDSKTATSPCLFETNIKRESKNNTSCPKPSGQALYALHIKYRQLIKPKHCIRAIRACNNLR